MQYTNPIKYSDSTWDFKNHLTKEFTHCFHNYPAMMIPSIPRQLLIEYGKKDGWLLDPYCGTGTSLVESSIYRMNAVGCDINPLARLIATTKITSVSLEEIDAETDNLYGKMFISDFAGNNSFEESQLPPISNRDYWFSKEVILRLAILRQHILSIVSDSIRNFFWVAFSETVRDCSYTKNSEFKLTRMDSKNLMKFNPKVSYIFSSKVNRNRYGLASYLQKRNDIQISIEETNTAEHEKPISTHELFDLVITSPPYGDSNTTVAYGQFSRLSAEWIGLESPKIDKVSMGGVPKEGKIEDRSIKRGIDSIYQIDEKRASQVESFYIDLENSIETVASVMNNNSTICYVVGNRTVRGVTLPTDEFVAHTFKKCGFQHKKTIIRNIPNKRMPLRNSPSNIAGITADTIRNEYIVICQRTK